MRQKDRHISDAELIQAADGELHASRAAEVDRHLEACWSCRSRRIELDRAIADFVAAHQSSYEDQASSIDGPRALLEARMAQYSETAPSGFRTRSRNFLETARLGYAAIALALAVALTGLLYVAGAPWRTREVYAMSMPDSGLTPGATLPVTREYVCAAAGTDSLHAVPMSIARRVFEQYGVSPAPRAYEVDYLITPALGGAADVRNLWPQPYDSGVWNARVKDALEDHLQQLVCDGRVNLDDAQTDIASDWVAAYKKYFETNKPLANHAQFSKDLPWE